MSDLGVLSWAKPSGSTGKQDLVKAALSPIPIPLCPSSNSHHSPTLSRQAQGSASKASNHSSKGDNEVEKWIWGEGRLFVTTFYSSLWGNNCICSAM